ncbi:MAG: hypothetical protein ACE14S_08725 [Candidatus Bathyarchaeia archaeon]
MKIGIKLLIAAVLSLSVGVAFASPMLVSELSVHPYPSLPKGPTPEMDASVAYASFTAQPADSSLEVPEWYRGNSTPTTVAYSIVLNVTNLSDEYAAIDFIEANAAENYTRGPASFMMNGVTGTAGTHRGAYLDGELINVTWIPNSGRIPTAPHPSIPGQPDWPSNLPWEVTSNETFPADGYWREGVEIADTYVNGTLAYTYMYINGTWTDVTGRVQVPDREDPFSRMSSASHSIAGGWYSFQMPLPEGFNNTETHTSTTTHDYGNGTTVTITTTTTEPPVSPDTERTVDELTPSGERVTIYMGPGRFNNTWAPHESRLIMLSGTIVASDANVSKYLQAGSMAVHIMGQARLANMVINGVPMDTTTVIDVIQQIQVQAEGKSFVYSGVLGAHQVFQQVPNQSGVEVCIKPAGS